MLLVFNVCLSANDELPRTPKPPYIFFDSINLFPPGNFIIFLSQLTKCQKESGNFIIFLSQIVISFSSSALAIMPIYNIIMTSSSMCEQVLARQRWAAAMEERRHSRRPYHVLHPELDFVGRHRSRGPGFRVSHGFFTVAAVEFLVVF